MSPAKAAAFSCDTSAVQEAIRTGVTAKRTRAGDNHWQWWQCFCLEHELDPFLRDHDNPVPIRAINQAYTCFGSPDLRKDVHGKTNFRLACQMRAYRKQNAPPKRVKPLPITIVLHVLNAAYASNSQGQRAIADMITVAFFYLLRPGEYTGTTTNDTPFRLRDVTLHLEQKQLTAQAAVEIEAATAVTYEFTTQKNGIKGERLSYGRSGHGCYCTITHICPPTTPPLRLTTTTTNSFSSAPRT